MSYFTEGVTAGAFVKASANIAPSPALPVSKPHASISISWLGIAGIIAAFLVLASVAVAYLWYKRNLYKKALQEQRNFYVQNAASQTRDDWTDDEEQGRINGKSKRGFNGLEGSVPVGSRDPKARGSRDTIIPGSFRDKHMTGCFKNSHQGEVFYTGDEGSQMGVRYSKEELGNIEILTCVSTPRQKRKAESESTSLLGVLTRSHTISASPTKEMDRRNRLGRWLFRTFSLPAYHRKSSQETVVTSWGAKEESKVVISPLTPHPSSLPASPLEHNLAPSAGRKPSRFSYAAMHHPAFVVPPSTPPPPLPLPMTLDEAPEKTLQELRRAMKQAESKWTIANYFPAPAPPPLPVPFRAPVSPPPPPPPPPPLRRSPLVLPSLSEVNTNPPSFRDLVQSAPAPAPALPPPPPPPPPRRANTLPAKLLLAHAREPPPPPPPPPLSSPSRKVTPPPSPTASPASLTEKFHTPPSSPPSFPTPPPSPPPSPLPVGASGNGLLRPNLALLTLPGRSDHLAENLEFLDEQRLSKRHQKMRPLHWDKLKPDAPTVWDNIRNSMELDEEMIANLFGVSSRPTPSSVKRFAASPAGIEKNEILDPRKAHNIAIQLRARGLSRAEVRDALIEGDGLGQETLEVLVKMSPSEEEVSKFREYKGDATLLGPADRFLLGILQVPNAFHRLDAMLYRTTFKEELQYIRETISSLQMACRELKESRTFTKLLEAVLKTGNRLNVGTFRGDAKAFKLDTLLKLADVKGVDGKTTLLHFVIQEIVKAEGARAARLAGFYDVTTPTSTSSTCTTPNSASSPGSPLSHFARSMEVELARCQSDDWKDDFRKIGMDVVKGIPTELIHVRKAGALDVLALSSACSRLHSGLEDMKTTLEKLRVSSEEIVLESSSSSTYELTDDVFREKMRAFVAEAEGDVRVVQSDLELVLASVKDISVYFYGEADTAKSAQPLKVFVVMREFLAMLERACKDVMKSSASPSSSSSSQSQLPSSRLRSSPSLPAK